MEQELLQFVPPECRACCKRCGCDKHGGRDLARIENGLRLRKIVGVPIVERHGGQSGTGATIRHPAHQLMEADDLEMT